MGIHYFDETSKIDPIKLRELEKNCELDGNFMSDNYNFFSAEEFADLLSVPINIIEMRAQYAGHIIYYNDHNRCSICKKFIPVGEGTCCNTSIDYEKVVKDLSIDWEKVSKSFSTCKRRYDKGGRDSYYCPLCLVPFPLYRFETHAKSEHGREFMEFVMRTNIQTGDTIFKPYDGKCPKSREEYITVMSQYDSEDVKRELLGESYVREGVDVLAVPMKGERPDLSEIAKILGSEGNGRLKKRFMKFLRSKGFNGDVLDSDDNFPPVGGIDMGKVSSYSIQLFKKLERILDSNERAELKLILSSEDTEDKFDEFVKNNSNMSSGLGREPLFVKFLTKVILPMILTSLKESKISELMSDDTNLDGGSDVMKATIEDGNVSHEESYVLNMSGSEVEKHKKFIISVYYRGRKLRNKGETKLEDYKLCPICNLPLNTGGALQNLQNHLLDYHKSQELFNLYEGNPYKFVSLLESYNGDMIGLREHMDRYPIYDTIDIENSFRDSIGIAVVSEKMSVDVISENTINEDSEWKESESDIDRKYLENLSVRLGYTNSKQLAHNYKQNCKANAKKEEGTVYECPYCLVPVAPKGVMIHVGRHGNGLEALINKHGVDVVMGKYDGVWLSEDEFLRKIAKHTKPSETKKIVEDKIRDAREMKRNNLAEERVCDEVRAEKSSNLKFDSDDMICAEFGYPNTHNLCMNLSNSQRSADKRAKSGEDSYICPICLIPFASSGLKPHSNRHGNRFTKLVSREGFMDLLEKYKGNRKITSEMIFLLSHQPPMDEILDELEERLPKQIGQKYEMIEQLSDVEDPKVGMIETLETVSQIVDFEPVWEVRQKAVEEISQENVEVPINKNIPPSTAGSFLEVLEARAVNIVDMMDAKQVEIDSAFVVYEQLMSEKEKMRLEKEYIKGILTLHDKEE